MSAFGWIGSIEKSLALATSRFHHWDRESRARSLHDWESKELERALRQMDKERSRLVRAQAAPPPARSRRGKR